MRKRTRTELQSQSVGILNDSPKWSQARRTSLKVVENSLSVPFQQAIALLQVNASTSSTIGGKIICSDCSETAPTTFPVESLITTLIPAVKVSWKRGPSKLALRKGLGGGDQWVRPGGVNNWGVISMNWLELLETLYGIHPKPEQWTDRSRPIWLHEIKRPLIPSWAIYDQLYTQPNSGKMLRQLPLPTFMSQTPWVDMNSKHMHKTKMCYEILFLSA